MLLDSRATSRSASRRVSAWKNAQATFLVATVADGGAVAVSTLLGLSGDQTVAEMLDGRQPLIVTGREDDPRATEWGINLERTIRRNNKRVCMASADRDIDFDSVADAAVVVMER